MDGLEIEIIGRVQGVGLRQSVKGKAVLLGINGIIFNKEDGAVFIIAQGERKNLEKFIGWLSSNPGFSRV
jgi:acylphosphatase